MGSQRGHEALSVLSYLIAAKDQGLAGHRSQPGRSAPWPLWVVTPADITGGGAKGTALCGTLS